MRPLPHRSFFAPVFFTAVVALVAASCSRAGEENLGLVGAPSRAVDLTRLTDPAELGRALALAGPRRDEALGAHQIAASSSLALEPAGHPAQKLDETYRLESDGRGNLHVLHDNSRGYGTEATALGADLYVRPRYGTFVRRRPEPGEVERLRAGVESVAGDYLTLLEPWLVVRESGRTQVAGHPAIQLTLSARETPTSRARRDRPPGWRDTVKVRSIRGELSLDEKSGVPLDVRLEAAYTFERNGEPLSVRLAFKQSTAAGAGPIRAPEAALPSPTRVRPLVERQLLLDGLKDK